MFISYNVSLSTHRNYFFDHFLTNNYHEGINIDVHPLYGHTIDKKIPKLIWSFKTYLLNPFFFNMCKHFASAHEQDAPPQHVVTANFDSKHIAYYIIIQVVETDSTFEAMIDLEKIQSDLNNILSVYPSHVVRVYMPVVAENSTLEYANILSSLRTLLATYPKGVCMLYTQFDLKSAISDTKPLCVVSNMFSSLFVLCYTQGVPAIVISDLHKNRMHLRRFFADIHMTNLEQTTQNAHLFVHHMLPHFETDDDYNINLFKNKFFRHVFNQTPNNIPNAINPSQNVYVHENFNHEYNTISEGIVRAGCTSVPSIGDARVIVSAVDESVFMKHLLKIKSFNLIVFIDTNFNCLVSKETYFRFNCVINGFPLKISYNHKSNDELFHSDTINHNPTGYILVVLDNYNGITYKSVYDWISKWTPIFELLQTNYSNNFKIKVHPNNKEAKKLVKQTFLLEDGVFVHDSVSLEELLKKNDIRFCVQRTGTSYVKGYQFGVPTLSLYDTVNSELGIYSMHQYNTDANEVVERYTRHRKLLLDKYVHSNLVPKEDLSTGRFFQYLQSIL